MGRGKVRGTTGRETGDSGSASSADALDAVAEDTLRAVLAGRVRGGGAGHNGSLEDAFRRTPDGVDRLGSGLPHLLKLEHH